MDIIDLPDLASYLDFDEVTFAESPRAVLLVALANDLVSEKWAGDLPVPPRVIAITLEVAARAFRNPNGYSSETVDDYTYRRDADTRQAGVYLTDAELVELGGSTATSVYQGWLA